MTRATRLSRGRRHGAASLAAGLAVLVSAASAAQAKEVIIHDRGKRIVVTDADADDIEAICVGFLRSSRDRGDALPTEGIAYLRSDEVTVEIHYDSPQTFEVGTGNDRAHPQHLLVPLTGTETGLDGNLASVYIGRTAPPNEVPYIGIPYYNRPDRNGVQYGGSYFAPGELEKLRQKVAQLGVDAPRATPRPAVTPDLTPMRLDEED